MTQVLLLSFYWMPQRVLSTNSPLFWRMVESKISIVLLMNLSTQDFSEDFSLKLIFHTPIHSSNHGGNPSNTSGCSWTPSILSAQSKSWFLFMLSNTTHVFLTLLSVDRLQMKCTLAPAIISLMTFTPPKKKHVNHEWRWTAQYRAQYANLWISNWESTRRTRPL